MVKSGGVLKQAKLPLYILLAACVVVGGVMMYRNYSKSGFENEHVSSEVKKEFNKIDEYKNMGDCSGGACMHGDCSDGICPDGRQCETLTGEQGDYGEACMCDGDKGLCGK